MKTIALFIVAVLIFIINTFGQKPTIHLTFTAKNNDTYLQLDSIKVMNRSTGIVTMLYWPDTTLYLETQLKDWMLYIGYAKD